MYLGQALATNTSVERLTVSLSRGHWNGDELGVRLFAEGLRANTTLKVLNISCPSICQERPGVSAVGALHLFDMLRVNTALLSFSYNGAFEWDGGGVVEDVGDEVETCNCHGRALFCVQRPASNQVEEAVLGEPV